LDEGIEAITPVYTLMVLQNYSFCSKMMILQQKIDIAGLGMT